MNTRKEQEEIKAFIEEFIAENPHLYGNKHIEYLIQGVASHHAGLLPAWKNLVENYFKKDLSKLFSQQKHSQPELICRQGQPL